jgi:hypothetical protein
MRNVWSTLPRSYDDIVDETLLLGDVCYDLLWSREDVPRGAAIARLELGQALTWLDRGDVVNRTHRNRRRLLALRRSMLSHYEESAR